MVSIAVSFSAAVALHCAVNITLGVPFGHSVPLIIVLFALAQTDLDFYTGILEIHAQGYQGIPVLLDIRLQTVDLPLVHQQAAGPHRVPVEDVAVLVGTDMHSVEIHLAVFGDAVGILQIKRKGPDGFELRTVKLKPRLIAVLDEIVMVCLTVLRRYFDAFFLRHGLGPPSQSGLF